MLGGDGTWTPLINLGSDISSEISENCPMLSPDGKYFFFSRWDCTNGSTWWVEAAALEALRPAGLE